MAPGIPPAVGHGSARLHAAARNLSRRGTHLKPHRIGALAPGSPPPLARRHERFRHALTLTPEEASAAAYALNDTNPVHHDAQFAAGTRYGRPIASGAHTAALLFALTASHFSAKGSVVGLGFSIRYRRPVYADETIVIEWLVRDVRPNSKLGGDVVELRGRVKCADGKSAIIASGQVLVTRRL